MLGMSNAAVFGLSLTAVTAAAVTIAGVNGVFDPWINRTEIAAQDQSDEAKIAKLADGSAKTNVEAPVAEGTPAKAADGQVIEQAEAIMPTKKPVVDIVRVEPSGDAVIAGQSDAGALVAVLSNGNVVGKGVANDAGDWAIVLDKPLDPGGHDISVEAQRTETTDAVIADDRIAVHVPEDESEGVLVTTSKPGSPTEVVQVPEAEETVVADLVENPSKEPGKAAAAPKETIASEAIEKTGTEPVAATNPVVSVTETDPASETEAVTPKSTEEAAKTVIAKVTDPAEKTAKVLSEAADASDKAESEAQAKELVVANVAPDNSGQSTSDDKAGTLVTEQSTGEGAEPVSSVKEQGTSVAPAKEDATKEDTGPVVVKAQETGNAVEKPETAVESIQSAQKPDSTASEPAAPSTTITNIPETETSETETKAADPQVAQAPVEVQPKAKPVQIRKPDPVVEEIVKENREETVVAAVPAQEPVNVETKPAKKITPEPEPEPSVTVKAVEAEEGQVYVAGESDGEGPVRVYIEEKFVGQAKPNPEGQWVLKAPKTIDPGQHSVRADKIKDKKGTVTARAEVVFEREADEVALTPVIAVGSGASGVTAGADVDAGRRQIPAMIIRKGDNLWRISQRHYGQGVRYTTIYQANQGQITNPDLIFPGQVFLLPERDLNWVSN